MMRHVGDALFRVWMTLVTLVLGLTCLWGLLLPRGFAVFLVTLWARLVIGGLRVLCGVRHEVRGLEHAPRAPTLIAAKHQSPWETIAAFLILKDPAIILKKELMNIPVYGWWARKLDMIPIDRAGRAKSLRAMQAAAKRALADGRPVVIFPEGTRRKPGAAPDYKPGVAGLYRALEAPCTPVALNSGLAWRAEGPKAPGLVTWEYLPEIPPGLARKDFMAKLETTIEPASAALLPPLWNEARTAA